MNLEQMRDRITILKSKQQTGPIVDLSDSSKWEEYCQIWVKVEYLKGAEFFAAKAINAESSIKFIIRYRTDITVDMAVQYGIKILNIISACPLDSRRTWLMITAKEVIASA